MKAFRTLFFAAALLSPNLLHAQMEDRPLMSVNIPFAFTVENTRLPAGQYFVSMVEYNHFWEISTLDHKTNALFHVLADQNSPAATGDSALVFSHYPTDYVLTELRDHNRGIVAEVYPGKRGKQLAQRSSPQLTMIRAQAF
ncbi:MAG TPA: hypothetical protein VHT24_17545 [Pseudacidobacterium sp.]|jgi:hypothetical protein|nr:hypothetical protein [Pseudacidobacterium sp.]